MKNSFMWKRGDGGNRRKRGNMGRKEIGSERRMEGGRRKERKKGKVERGGVMGGEIMKSGD